MEGWSASFLTYSLPIFIKGKWRLYLILYYFVRQLGDFDWLMSLTIVRFSYCTFENVVYGFVNYRYLLIDDDLAEVLLLLFSYYLRIMWVILYFTDVHDMNIQDIGFISGIPHFCGFVGVIGGTILADYLKNRKIMSVTTVRIKIVIPSGEFEDFYWEEWS